MSARDEPRSLVPSPLSSFVGREADLARVRDLLEACRMLTLAGPPGVGKTRLALRAAAELQHSYPHGAWFVELAPVAEPDRVLAAVTSALAVRTAPNRAPVDCLLEHLRRQHVLLVLDNCEHVIGAVAELASTLLQSCPGLHVLATSREPLEIGGEHVWRVRPLSYPAAGAHDDEQALARYEAVRLFCDRAQAVEPTFTLTGAVAGTVADICRRLDGVPLAIELAAARAGSLTPAQILGHLDDRLRLLSSDTRTAPARQRTLHAALEWSHELLCEEERALLRRLSVFAGSWTLDATHWVGAGAPLQAADTVHVLGQLVAKSLVLADTSGTEARYRMLETIRRYGAEKLAAAGEEATARDALLDWYRDFAERAEDELTGPEQLAWFARLGAETDNIRAALDWAILSGRAADGLRLATALSLFWHVRGDLAEGRTWISTLLPQAAAASPAVRAKATWGLAFLSLYAGDLAGARAVSEESVALARADGDPRLVARALSLLADLLILQNPVEGHAPLEEAVALSRDAGDLWCLADSLGKRGWGRLYHGDTAGARPFFIECGQLARSRHDKRNMRRGIGGLGWCALLDGDYAAATELLTECLALARELGDAIWTAQTLNALGELARAVGDYPSARAHIREALELGRSINAPYPISLSLGILGRVEAAEGDDELALQLFEEAAATAAQRGLKSFVTWWLSGRGEVHRRQGDGGRAEAAFDAALSLAREIGNRRDEARVLLCQGRLARDQEDHVRAASLLSEAAVGALETSDAPGALEALEALAGLSAAEGRADHAARLLAAADTQLAARGGVRPQAEQAAFTRELKRLREDLAEGDFREAWEQGAALALHDAVALATRGRGTRRRALTGWGSLTRAERDVAVLAAQGLTNREIGTRLFVSPRTVQAHLAHVFQKLDVHSRKELAERAPMAG